MSLKKRALATAATVAASLAIVGGAAVANAASGTPSPTPSAGSGAAASSNGTSNEGQDQRPRAHQHAAVTGEEATKVGDAVKAKDAAVTVTKIKKDPDGSYDVDGTKDGQKIRYEVSADLATITQRTGRGGGNGARCDGGVRNQPGRTDQGGPRQGQSPSGASAPQ